MSAAHSESLKAIGSGTVEVRVAKEGDGSHRKAGTIVVKLTAQDAKNFITSADPSSKSFKMKLPLKLKLTSDPNEPHSKLKAKLVLPDQQPTREVEDRKLQSSEQQGASEERGEELELPQLPSLTVQVSQGGPPAALIPIEETGDLFLEATAPETGFSCEWKSVSEFLFAVQDELVSNPTYSLLLDPELLSQALCERNNSHFNFEQLQQLLSLALNYLALSRNYSQDTAVAPIATTLQLRSFAETLGKDLLRLKEEVFASNKSILKVLDYIQPKCEGEGSRYTHCFFNLNFDLSAEEVARVAEAVKYQCRYNHKAFCFLTNYLLKSCRTMEHLTNACIREIEDSLLATINRLIADHPPSKSLEGDEALLQRHPSFRLDRSHYPCKTLNLQNIPRDKKIELLESFISLRARDAQRNSGAFALLIKDVCSQSGSQLTTGVKIRSMRKRRAIERVKEKVLDGISLRHRAELQLDINPNLPIDAYTEAEFEQYKQRLNAIFLSLEESIEFGVDDLLRGRCMFASLDSLNNCCTQLKEEIPRRGFTLLAVRNRLKERSCDMILHVRMGETVAEVQLVLNYKLAQNEFSAKLDHLRRALFYNHITHLKLTNEKITYLFLEEVTAYLRSNNTACSPKDYHEKTDYTHTKQNLERFIKELPFKVDRAELEAEDVELSMLAPEIRKFSAILTVPTSPVPASSHKLKHNGDFLYELADYDQSLKNQVAYSKAVEQKHEDLIANAQTKELTEQDREVLKNYAGAIYVIGKIHMRAKNYDAAVKHLQQSGELTDVLGNREEYLIETLQHEGEIEYRRNNLQKAAEIYTRLLSFPEAAQTPDQNIRTRTALALVYQRQGNYFEAARQLNLAIPVIEHEKGTEHLQLAAIYNHLGATHHLEGELAASLDAYRRSLAIVEHEKGKNSIDCASVLANIGLIYEADANYFEAAKHYERALSICNKHNLKESTYANAAFGLGNCFSALKNYSKAIQTYEKSLKHYSKQKGQLYYASVTEIAKAYEALGEEEAANRYYDLLQVQ